ncbi:MAG TPA: MFS transporter [Acidimicrobiia bacterium]|jgi:MFS family permease|nr:MFS transporter [Acidimicrobiia bacterium]
MAAAVGSAEELARREYKIWSVILASSMGTVIEWYDFYIFGTLATTLAPRFYPAEAGETVQLLLYLSTFAVGFVVRPFGAIFFGRIGDLVGRKYAFLVTLLIMGTCTAAVGLLPSYKTIGIAAPIILIVLRIFQGLALGGEYGGAAIYVAEHVPDKKRGFYTAFIQVTATAGLFVAIIVVIVTTRIMTPHSFERWGYRIPFLISILLVFVSLFIRVRMKESPIFQTLKDEGKTSKTPLADALKGWENWKRILTTLFGATAGQAVIWYTGQFYALFYLTTILRLPTEPARWVIAIGILIGMPLFLFFGALSDRIGRKKIMLTGMLLGALFYIPIYHGMQSAARTNVVKLASKNDPVTGEPKLQGLTKDGKIVLNNAKKDKTQAGLLKSGKGVVPLHKPNYPLLVLFIVIQMVFVTMVYGPIAAYLVEAFPAKVRYTSLSLPYHLGNGLFGGMLPLIGLYINSATKNIYAGLWYPIIVASFTFVVGSFLLKETKDVRIWDELEAARGHVPTA